MAGRELRPPFTKNELSLMATNGELAVALVEQLVLNDTFVKKALEAEEHVRFIKIAGPDDAAPLAAAYEALAVIHGR